MIFAGPTKITWILLDKCSKHPINYNPKLICECELKYRITAVYEVP